mgnify:FL=1
MKKILKIYILPPPNIIFGIFAKLKCYTYRPYLRNFCMLLG